MKLGLGRDEVKLVMHDPMWSKEFLKIQEQISNSVNININRIEHIGSTAIKEIMSKPIIDIMVGVDDIEKVEESFFKGLQTIGFYRLKVVREGEIVLAKFTDKTYKIKTHYIHLVNFQGVKWSNLLFFKNCLNSNKLLRKEYEQIKLSYISEKSTGIDDYTESKSKFVNKIFNMNE